MVREPLESGAVMTVAGAQARHARVRRVAAGDNIVVLDGTGGEAAATVISLDAGSMIVRISGALLHQSKEMPAITLFVPPLRMPVMAWLVEKGTELGASRITVVESARSQAKRALQVQAGRARLARVGEAAARQCGRGDVPLLEGPIAFSAALDREAGLRILFDPLGEAVGESANPRDSTVLWVGPEGGFTREELELARQRGWKMCRLPGYTLRAETAAVAALVAVISWFDSVRQGADNNAPSSRERGSHGV